MTAGAEGPMAGGESARPFFDDDDRGQSKEPLCVSAAPPKPELRCLDWDRAVRYHQSEEQLRAHLVNYVADLGRAVDALREARRAGDQERLREVAQQVMGSSSYLAASRLHECAKDLAEAIDLDLGGAAELAEATAEEAETLQQELEGLYDAEEEAGAAQATSLPKSPSGVGAQPACCCIS